MSHTAEPFSVFLQAVRELRDLLKDLVAHVTVSLTVHQRRRLKDALLALRFPPDEMLEMLHSFLATNEPADLEQADTDLARSYPSMERALDVIRDITRIIGLKSQAQGNKLVEIANIFKKGIRHDAQIVCALSDYHPKRAESVQKLITRIDEYNEVIDGLYDVVDNLGVEQN